MLIIVLQQIHMKDKALFFYGLSFLVAYYYFTGGSLYYDDKVLILVAATALWFNMPFWFSDKEDLKSILPVYVVWVIIQLAILYFGFEPYILDVIR